MAAFAMAGAPLASLRKARETRVADIAPSSMDTSQLCATTRASCAMMMSRQNNASMRRDTLRLACQGPWCFARYPLFWEIKEAFLYHKNCDESLSVEWRIRVAYKRAFCKSSVRSIGVAAPRIRVASCTPFLIILLHY